MSNFISKIALDTSSLTNSEYTEKLEALFRRCIEQRCGASVGCSCCAEYIVSLSISADMKSECYTITSANGKTVIEGGDFNALVFGMGKFLHTSKYSDDGILPSSVNGSFSPKTEIRAVYFAMHFFNWYQQCSLEEMEEHIEDLMLWGYNAVFIIFPKLNLTGWDDPHTAHVLALFRKVFSAAKRMNMKTGYQSGNQDFINQDMSVAADKSKLYVKNAPLICTSTEAGYLRYESILMHVINEVKDLGIDYISFWPYDEGGCSCDKCWMWGPNGFYNAAKRFSARIKKDFPEIKTILSTWLFAAGKYNHGEWELFYKRIEEERAKGEEFIDYILVDSRDIPVNQYVRQNGGPGGNIKVITFPDTCMTGLEPWGCVGAVATPNRMLSMWVPYQSFAKGGYIYSEGKFDDINKAVMSSLFWDDSVPVYDTVREYAGYEYPGCDPEDIKKLIELIEFNHDLTHRSIQKPADLEKAAAARALAEKIDAELTESAKKSWRWRILLIRTRLDEIRYSRLAAAGWDYTKFTPAYRFNFWGDYLEGVPEAEEALLELIHIYKAFEKDDPDKYYLHSHVRPPLRK